MNEIDKGELVRLVREEAYRQHDAVTEMARRAHEATVQGEQGTLRALFLLNGGALVALLAFLSALASSPSFDHRLALLAPPLVTFAKALVVAAAAYGGAAVTNYSGYRSIIAMRKTWEHPFTISTPKADRWMLASAFFQGASVAAAIGSLAMFAAGFLQIRDAVLAF